MRDSSENRLRTWLGFALACLVAFGILTLWVRPRWAVSAVQIGVFALTIVWLFGVMRRGFSLRLHPLMLPLAGATLWGCLQLATGATVYRWATEVAVLDWFTRLAVFLLALQLYSEPQPRRRLLRGLLWFGFLLSCAAILQRFTSPQKIFWLFETELETVMGPFVYHNQYAAFIETVLPLALVTAALEPRRLWLYSAMAAVMVASVVAAVSRAGVALVALEIVAVLALAHRRARLPRRALTAVAGATLLSAGIFVTAVGWRPLLEKFQRTNQYGERRDLLLSSLEMARDRPWLGFGLGTWSTAYPAYARFDDGRFDNQAHNDWVQWAAEGGVPFFALMAAIAVLLVRPARRTVWAIGLLAVLAHSLVDYHFQQRPVFGYYYFTLAAVAVARGRSVGAPAAQHHPHGAGEDV